MILISYDIQNNKTRSHLSKFLKKFGRKIQYSVYEIKNSQRILTNILTELELKYSKKFHQADSVIIFTVCATCQQKIKRYGYSSNDQKEVIIFE